MWRPARCNTGDDLSGTPSVCAHSISVIRASRDAQHTASASPESPDLTYTGSQRSHATDSGSIMWSNLGNRHRHKDAAKGPPMPTILYTIRRRPPPKRGNGTGAQLWQQMLHWRMEQLFMAERSYRLAADQEVRRITVTSPRHSSGATLAKGRGHL